MAVAATAPPSLEVVLEIRVALGDPGDGGQLTLAERRAAEVGVEEDSRRVYDGAKQGSPVLLHERTRLRDHGVHGGCGLSRKDAGARRLYRPARGVCYDRRGITAEGQHDGIDAGKGA
jgi:hypothetical protein